MRPTISTLERLTIAMITLPKLEVFKAVVILDAVDMVNRFGMREIAAKMLLHYKAMFGDVALLTGKWVAPLEYLHVAIAGNDSPTFEVVAGRATYKPLRAMASSIDIELPSNSVSLARTFLYARSGEPTATATNARLRAVRWPGAVMVSLEKAVRVACKLARFAVGAFDNGCGLATATFTKAIGNIVFGGRGVFGWHFIPPFIVVHPIYQLIMGVSSVI